MQIVSIFEYYVCVCKILILLCTFIYHIYIYIFFFIINRYHLSFIIYLVGDEGRSTFCYNAIQVAYLHSPSYYYAFLL